MSLFRPYRRTFRHLPVSFELSVARLPKPSAYASPCYSQNSLSQQRPESCTMIPGRMHMTLAINQREREGILILALAGQLTLGHEHLAFRTTVEKCIDAGNVRV